MRAQRKLKFWLNTCAIAAIAAATALTATPAFAQEEPESDVIYVTAQRRVENMQDVPIAVSAVSGEQAQQLLSGGGDVLQLAGRVPGLHVESSNGRAAPRFYIRGLGNIDFDIAASQPVSVLIDDVVMENVALKAFPIFDVQQIEVLRGPQGTLFGRNTPAGIVHFRSVRPSQDTDASFSVSYGSFGSASVEGAYGGAITDTLSGRASIMYRRRDDWVDNDFNGSELGGFDDVAARFQLLWDVSPNANVLFNLHGRSLEGTSTLFRANVLSTGSNELNANFDRDHVFYDGGAGNPQEYDGHGGSATVNWDLGGMTLTSITAYETTEGTSRGDIDGGVVGVGPGFIPFSSDTRDGIDDLDQFTQEVRLASEAGPFNWQVGAFYFDSDLVATTVGFPGPPAATLNHTNTSWAVFGQVGYELSDALTVTAGVRYTEDEKDLTGVNVVIAPVSASVEEVSWDLSAVYELSDTVNLYARVANGFRAPTIQGRDVVFGGSPTVADSETIQSYEVGFKSDLLDRSVRLNGAVFYYTIEDQQLSAIGGLGNFNQLVNAEEGEGYGFELEGQFQVTDNLTARSAFTYNHTEIQDSDLVVGSPCATLPRCTLRDPTDGLGNAFIDGNPFPNAPEFTLDVGLDYERPLASGATLFASTDWVARGETNIFLYDAVEFQTDMQFEGGARLGYRSPDGRWEFAGFARNITDEENVIGAIDFNNNTAFVNEPRVFGLSVAVRN